MNALIHVLRWPLLPVLGIGLANTLIWFGTLVAFGFRPWTITVAALPAIIAGVVTPNRFHTLAALCLTMPGLLARSRQHGALIDSLLGGFVLPLSWIYFVTNFTALYIAYRAFMWGGSLVKKGATAAKRQRAAR